ncbi:phage tail protein [Clostridium botulinum]|uniref:phage tail protein n=1 Tax=Clostridium botulinum TaxID=1491 RepID=UPI00077463B3|nr:phage tail protein [Clostridium botulinum]
MSVFRVFVDGQLFYHPQLSQLAITKAQVQEDVENIDSLTLAAPFNHPYLSVIKPMASTIVCKKGGRTVFEGRALDEGSDFYNTHTWTCESCLAYLKDTIQPPYDYQGTLRGLLEYFLSEHNRNVEDKKKFTLGNVTVTDDNDYVHYSSSEYSVTLDAIKAKLLNTHGGYLIVRYTDSGRVLDYLADFNEHSVQTVEFGKNLLDVKVTKDHGVRATAFIPLGAKIMSTDSEGNEVETDERVDITSVNEGKNYIYNEEAVNGIGWIWASEIWEDVTVPGNLLRKANSRLLELVNGITSMELTIVDESDTGADIGDIHAREYVECLSPPHGIDGRYLCIGKTTDYLNPAGNTITIGASGVKLTLASVKQEQSISALEEDITDSARQLNENISSLLVEVHECYSEITKTSEQINMAVREEYITRTEIEEIQKDFETIITQNSTEIRMDFTQVTDSIKGEVAVNQQLLEEYIRFRGALIELGKVGNAFTAELSNEELAFKENGQKIAYISNQILVITNAEIRNKLSLGNESRGWFDFIPRTNGNLSIKWRGST